MSVSIRQFRPADEPFIQECCRAAYSAVFAEVSDDWRPKAHKILENNIIGRGLSNIAENLAERRNGIAWVAETDGNIAGWADAYQHDDDVSEVVRLFVHPEYQRRGIAARLMDESENWARNLGSTTMYLESAHPLIGAHQFYLHRGYLLTGSHRLSGDSAEVTMLEFERTL